MKLIELINEFTSCPNFMSILIKYYIKKLEYILNIRNEK